MSTKKRFALSILALAGFCVVLALVLAIPPRDPLYKGKHLSDYLEKSSRGVNGLRGGGFVDEGKLREPRLDGFFGPETSDAITAVGTDALPMLAGMLKARESKIRTWLRKATAKMPTVQTVFNLRYPNSWQRQIMAAEALIQLGTNAAPAIPRIVPLLTQTESAGPALFALMRIVRPSHSEEIILLTNVFGLPVIATNHLAPFAQESALIAFGRFGTNAACAVPFLLNCLTSTNSRASACSAASLARIGFAAELAVPLIVANLPKTNPPLLGFDPRNGYARASEMALNNDILNVWALGKYGTNAQAALPALSNLFGYPDWNMKRELTNAIEKIKGNAPQK